MELAVVAARKEQVILFSIVRVINVTAECVYSRIREWGHLTRVAQSMRMEGAQV